MNECQFCKKSFKSAKTLSVHMCTRKRRWADRDTIGARLGFRVYQQFYKMTTQQKAPKTQEVFIKDRMYSAFVKYGRHLADLNPIDADKFIEYVIRNGVAIDKWCFDSTYNTYLKEHIAKEPAERAFERTVLEMQRWATENDLTVQQFFNDVNTFEAVNLVRSGRISPWILYLAPSSDLLWDRFSEEQEKIIYEAVDAEVWKNKFNSQINDVVFVKSVAKSSGL